MKIVRINKGKAVNLPFRFLAVIVMVFLTITLMDALPEPLSIFIVIIIASLLPAIWFATKVIIIDEEHKTIFDGVWTMGKKLGEPANYDSIEKIFINKVKTSQTMYSLSNNRNVVTNHEFRAYLKLSNGDKYLLLTHPLEERVKEKVTKIKQKLDLK